MLTNAAIQYVLPATTIAAADRPAADAMRLIAGHWGAALVSIGMAVSICATFVGSSLSGARVPFAAARDGLFFKQLAHVHSRFHTPSTALILQAVLSSLLLLAIGQFQALFSLAIFAEWFFYALTASTVFVFRHREPNATRPYSVWGYPVLPALFIARRNRPAGLLLRRPAPQLANRHRRHPPRNPPALHTAKTNSLSSSDFALPKNPSS